MAILVLMRYEVVKYDRIRGVRADKDYSQTLVAQHLNVAQNTLSQYETGERNIPNEVLVQLALLYDTSIDYLLGLTDEPAPYPRKRTK